jgi:hypothetical protein
LNFAPSFLITLHFFHGPLVISSVIWRGQRCIYCTALWNSHRPSVMLSVLLTRRQHTDGLKSIGQYVGDCGIFQLLFSNSLWNADGLRYVRQWLWHFPVIIFQLSVKCQRTLFRRYGRQWMWHFPVIIFQLSVKCWWTLFCRYRRRW